MSSNILKQLSSGLIVSCQALPEEPLHSSFIMGRMAKAAYEGGAIGIRANGYDDITEIKKVVDLPVIGIVKRDYDDSAVYITPTIEEVRELLGAKVDIIALDATVSKRPNNTTLESLIAEIKEINSEILLMADCSTVEEAKHAVDLGFDIISSTLVGYTEQSKNLDLTANDYAALKEMIDYTHANQKYFIAEGNMDTEDKIKNAFRLGVDSIVIGSMITRPQLITKRFNAIVQVAKEQTC